MLADVWSPQGVAVWRRLNVVHDDRDWAPHRLHAEPLRSTLTLTPDNDGAHEPLAECARGAPLDTDTPLELSLQVRPTLANGRVAERPCRRRGDAEPA